jgi:hypothetical protein
LSSFDENSRKRGGKIMKRYVVISILVIISLMLSSCVGSSRTDMLNKSSDEEVANEKLVKILDYIMNEDEESLKAMFSQCALDESKNFSENAKLLFKFFDGEIVSWEKDSGPHVSKSANYGEIVKEVSSYYFVKTDKGSYFFLINDFPVDDVNSNNEGLYMVLVVLAENRLDIFEPENEILYIDGEKVRTPGIYLPIK